MVDAPVAWIVWSDSRRKARVAVERHRVAGVLDLFVEALISTREFKRNTVKESI